MYHEINTHNQADKFFNLPKVEIAIHLRTPFTDESIENRLFFDLMWQALSNILGDDEEFYIAGKAGITVKLGGGYTAGEGRDRVSYEVVNPVILVSGYDMKIGDLFKQTVQFIAEYVFDQTEQFITELRMLMGSYVGILKRRCTRKYLKNSCKN